MNYQHYVGIDVSKETLDVTMINQEGIIEEQTTIGNTSSSLRKLLRCWRKKRPGIVEQTLFCLEPTGHYSNLTVAVLLDAQLLVWVANPSDIKNSIGMQRGKDDKTDAMRIAEYAFRFHDKARLVQPTEMSRLELQQLLTQRELLIKDRGKYSGQLEDYKGRIGENAYAAIRKTNKQIIRQLEKAIVEIEQKLEKMITDVPEMKRQYELLKTIPGIGKVVAQTLVVFTNGFTRFESARKLACHAGVAPFRYKSGTSVKGKERVSFRANKRLKSLLHMAALAAIKTNGELKTYYERKVMEGKNKMSVLNAVRNKIIHRVFAVLKRNTEYRQAEIAG
jgi:transposase